MVLPFTDREGVTYVTHTDLPHLESAFRRSEKKQLIVMAAILGLCILAGLWNWHGFLVGFIAVLTVVYFADLLFNLFLIYRSFSSAPEIVVTKEDLAVERVDWPKYTIFCPLYKEAEVLPQFVEAMVKLDYPSERLQIKLLLEENDPETIEAARGMNLPKQFEIVVVPHGMPKTKPKACNYGLLDATGEYTVIFDAEDVPEPDQLKKR